MDVIKVSGNSRTSAVAGAIAGVFREHRHAEVQAIGAGAVNQAVKAIVLARGYLAEDGLDVGCFPEFVDVDIEGKTRTAVRLTVEMRQNRHPAAEEDQVDSETPEVEDDLAESDVSFQSEAQEEPEEVSETSTTYPPNSAPYFPEPPEEHE